MGTEYIFKSCFASLITNYFSYRNENYLSCNDYILALRDFDKFCIDNRFDTNTLVKEIVMKWMDYHAMKGDSLYWRSICIRQFAKYLNSIGENAFVLPKSLYTSNITKPPYIATDEELRHFFSAADTIQTDRRRPFDCYIAPVIFRLQYTCGLRPNEVRLLKTSHVNLYNGEILIEKTKCHKQRIVVMSEQMLNLCVKYDAIRKKLSTNDTWMFPSDETAENPYNGKQLNRLFEKCWQNANPNIEHNELPRFCPYDLRHRYASTILLKWIDEGKELNAMLPFLQTYMGHERISHTAYYIHLLPEKLLHCDKLNLEQFTSIMPEVTVWKE